MPLIEIDANIKKLQNDIEKMTQEIFRLQGMLQTFEGFKRGGLTTIDLPKDPNQKPVEEPAEEPAEDPDEELESIQEKPE